ncbi:ClpXP protease specificity-enhancing factor [Simplicispira suum]|uniref:ClpXP protease specificity-enhancing factor n=1 Tax=Simplicispira suum TaxID=2109915 RepID=A0A2S0N142_9BURK|nr:ClpXP protease specificity-enhancing factor [Simplicispira suum]AVO41862.1 ClpXP protease specificity-enhancing factor [Simplicispira suum]MBW7832802.1 ClpXP protease specificity-enhancing factor [Simplicispira suum]
MNAQESTSTRPYLIRALHEWCSDNGFTPHIAVKVDESVRVPLEYVNNGEIILNVAMDATSSLQLGNDFIEFKARFGGQPRDILVPVGRVIAIYARENGQGMAFPPPTDFLPDTLDEGSALLVQDPPPPDARPVVQLVPEPASDSQRQPPDEPRPPEGGKGTQRRPPSLKRVK